MSTINTTPPSQSDTHDTGHGFARRCHDGFLRFVLWREQHVKERNFVLFLALLVGIGGGLAALVLKYLIHTNSNILTSHVVLSGGNWL